MKCDKMKDLLMTDYIDGRCSAREKSEVEKHLAGCDSCREFYSLLTKSAVEPFDGLKPMDAPDGMWETVSERINEKEQALVSVSRVFFPVRRAAFALAAFALAAALLTGVKVWRLYDTDLMTKYAQDQLYYFSGEETEADNDSFGTSVEELLM